MKTSLGSPNLALESPLERLTPIQENRRRRVQHYQEEGGRDCSKSAVIEDSNSGSENSVMDDESDLPSEPKGRQKTRVKGRQRQ